jgi:hypothetical protein
MVYFSLNTFIVGATFFGFTFLSNVAYALFCKAINVRILKFSLSFPPIILSDKIFGIDFELGGVPFGGFIKVFGFSLDSEEMENINAADYSVTFYSKPKYLKTIFKLLPWLFYLSTFLLSSLYFYGSEKFVQGLLEALNYLISSLKALFGPESMRVDLFNLTCSIVEGRNKIAFSIMTMSMVFIVTQPISSLQTWYSSIAVKNKLLNIIGTISAFVFVWVVFWKIPSLIFSYFTISQNFIYSFSFILGLYLSSFFCFFSTLYVVKNMSTSISEPLIK